VQLRFAINFLAETHILRGELSAAARLIEEDRLIAEVTGPPPVSHSAMMLSAWRGREREASELIRATARVAAERDLGMMVNFTQIMSAMLHNGLGRHEAARDAAWRAFQRDHFGFGSLVVPELAEAAASTGDTAMVRAALEWMTERTRVTPTEWALGTEAMIRALLGEGDVADGHYRESIEHLGRTPVRAQLARSHLLYGQWLRRENRRPDARAELRSAHDMLTDMGAAALAERARRELQATGETVRRRTAETAPELTAQEAHIARLAVGGLTNSEIGAQLFLSVRTVEWHLRKVYTKLGVGSRRELRSALSDFGQA
jgi:DNA-binding CsgD family transcriptional regulator